jgi:hypothetical protein
VLHSFRYSAKYPVIMIPGFVTSGLKLWKAHKCFEGSVYDRVWGGYKMPFMMALNGECWYARS